MAPSACIGRCLCLFRTNNTIAYTMPAIPQPSTMPSVALPASPATSADTIPTFLHVSWKYARTRSATLSTYRRVKTHNPWARVNARNTCFGEHPPLGASLELVSTYCAWQVERQLSPIA